MNRLVAEQALDIVNLLEVLQNNSQSLPHKEAMVHAIMQHGYPNAGMLINAF